MYITRLSDSVVKCCLTTAGDGKDHRLDSLKNDTMTGSENKIEGEKKVAEKVAETRELKDRTVEKTVEKILLVGGHWEVVR